MNSKESITYRDAGVDVERGYKAVDLIKGHVRSTYNNNVIGDLGGFGGLFSLDLQGIKNPVLVSGTDGVGTKLQVAFMADKHDTIGIDCVAMCVNDIACQGAKPLFFLDYIATGMIEPEKAADIVKGIAQGCREAQCALIGGETAEMPGFYRNDEYDLAGFSVGIVDRDRIITGNNIKDRDVLIGVGSSGLHSNGFSLVRKLIFEVGGYKIDSYVDELASTIGEELLKPTTIYVRLVNHLVSKFDIKGISHITGGGFFENIPRIFPQGLGARIDIKSFDTPPIFSILRDLGNIDNKHMFNTFNMGIGLVLAVSQEIAEDVVRETKNMGYRGYIIGEMIKGNGEIEI